MDKRTLFLANLPPGVSADQLTAMFGEYGEVEKVELSTHAKTGAPVAQLTMKVEREATNAINAANGVDIGGRRLAVSHPEVDLSKDLTSRQRKTAEAICADLGEMEMIPARQIHMMVRLCGPAFAQAIVEEAKVLDAGEGMMTADGARRRSVGGVFFQLATGRMAPPVWQIVISRKGKPRAVPPA